MKTLGTHILVDLFGVDPTVLDDEEALRNCLLNASKAMKATVLGSLSYRFQPFGVTALVSLAESHISMHTWPESGYAAVDIYTCGSLNPGDAMEYIEQTLKPKTSAKTTVQRGRLHSTN